MITISGAAKAHVGISNFAILRNRGHVFMNVSKRALDEIKRMVFYEWEQVGVCTFPFWKFPDCKCSSFRPDKELTCWFDGSCVHKKRFEMKIIKFVAEVIRGLPGAVMYAARFLFYVALIAAAVHFLHK